MFDDNDGYWNETWSRKIKKLYYDWVPYDYRPKNIWYYIKCKLWYKYNIVKVRTLAPTWCDRDYLLLHVNFQILTDFIEKEKPFEWFDIENSDCKKEWDELKELYNWWKKCMDHPDEDRNLLDPDFHEYDTLLHKMIKQEEEKSAKFVKRNDGHYVYTSYLKDENKYRDYVIAHANLEMLHLTFLENQLIRLIKLRSMMWT